MKRSEMSGGHETEDHRMNHLPWPSPVFKQEYSKRGHRVELMNPPFPPALDAAKEFLELVRRGELPYAEWTPGVSLRLWDDNGYEISYQQAEEDERTVRFVVP